MSRSGDTIVNPVTGERIIYRKTAAETNGQLLQFDYFMKPHSKGLATIAHTQPKLEQRMEVLEGTMTYTMGRNKVKKTLSKGEKVTIPRDVTHSLWNESSEELHILDEYSPPLNIQKFFETMYGLARDGKVNRNGLPNLLQISLQASFYTNEVGAGSSSQKFLFAVSRLFVPIAKGRGYEPWYSKYNSEGAE
jgi:mannose-6-phosphate isomerase-like protein (cupin superfamily)